MPCAAQRGSDIAFSHRPQSLACAAALGNSALIERSACALAPATKAERTCGHSDSSAPHPKSSAGSMAPPFSLASFSPGASALASRRKDFAWVDSAARLKHHAPCSTSSPAMPAARDPHSTLGTTQDTLDDSPAMGLARAVAAGSWAACALMLAAFVAFGWTLSAQHAPLAWLRASPLLGLGAMAWGFKALFERRARQWRQAEREARDANDALGDAIDAREAALSLALASLKRSLADALRASKLSTLGSLVAGVSHELNTPLGNAMVASDALQSRAEAVLSRLRQGQITKTELDAHFQAALALARLACGEASRAVELAASFKQISVDQASQRRRAFDLAQVARDVAQSFSPQIRAFPARVAIELDLRPAPALGQPGLAAEALTLMLQNCLAHAFEGRAQGRVRLEVFIQGCDVCAAVADDGVGVSETDLPKIFDPFFTTAPSAQRRGLGLAIANQRAHALGGSLSASSVAGLGLRVLLRFPAQPGKERP